MRKLGLIAAVVAAIAAPAAAAEPGFTIPSLKVSPPLGVFGPVDIGSCDLQTFAGCQSKTFTIRNVGPTTTLIGGFAVAHLDPLTAALRSGTPGRGCEFLPVFDVYWMLSPGASCEITAAMAPNHRGLVRNEVHIWSGSQADPIAVIWLFGIGK